MSEQHGTSAMETETSSFPAEGPVVLPAPEGGWTWAAYQQAVERFTEHRGHAPRVITMHPDTLDQILRTKVEQTEELLIERVVGVLEREQERLQQRLRQERRQRVEQHQVQIVTPPDHDQRTLVFE